jgi:hypothetical protein
VRSINRRIVVQEGSGKNQDLVSKISKAKMAGSMTQGVEYLPSKHEFKPQYHTQRKREEI